jgi:heterodisulfide reductase subunit B
MPYAYFPGCTLSTKAANYDVSGRAVAEALGMTLQELPDWQCCGATFPLATDNAMALIAPTRMLAQTQEAGGHTTTLCAVCYHVLKRTQVFLDRHPETLERINWFTDEPYEGGARISHFLELLRDEMGWEALKERVIRPLAGLKVAPYYGCLLLRPENEINLDDPDEPTILHDCLAALGCEVVDFPYKVECCGSYLAVSQPELAEELSREIVENARRRGAELVVTACPLCQFNLDFSQRPRDGRHTTTGYELPTVYFTQLMAMALGLDESVLGLEGHYVKPTALARYGKPSPARLEQLS